VAADRIEKEVVIAAPVERVWAVLTEPDLVSAWFSEASPARVDLRPGGIMSLDHGVAGNFPARIERVEPPRFLSYRWASAYPGEETTDSNSTLVEFTLQPEGEGTRLRLAESGFATLVIPPGREQFSSHDSHTAGWAGKLAELARFAEKPAA
jgi:uncharacterized protein YndB with AHSA1/START domain